MAKTPMEALDDYFFKELLQARNNPQAYERATRRFEEEHNLAAPCNYDAFRMRQKRKHKK